MAVGDVTAGTLQGVEETRAETENPPKVRIHHKPLWTHVVEVHPARVEVVPYTTHPAIQEFGVAASRIGPRE